MDLGGLSGGVDDGFFQNMAATNMGEVIEFEPMFKEEEYQDLMKNDEQENRKVFVDNELTINESKISNEGGKWWNLTIMHQTSKLETSDLCSMRGSDAAEKLISKKVVPVDDYFNRKTESTVSDPFLGDKESGVNLVEKTIEKFDETLKNEEEPEPEKRSIEINDDNVTFSNSLFTSKSENFSFTLNTSDSGDFIQKKVMESSKKQKLSPSNLKTIGEELERVSNRLANTRMEEMSKDPEASLIDLCSSLIKPGARAMLQMDETLSSISSSNTTSSSESKTRHSKPTKNSEDKKSSGSLTSTPSKLSSTKNESSSLCPSNNHHHSNSKTRNKFKKHKNIEIQTSPDRTSTGSMMSTIEKDDSKLPRTSTSSISAMGFVNRPFNNTFI